MNFIITFFTVFISCLVTLPLIYRVFKNKKIIWILSAVVFIVSSSIAKFVFIPSYETYTFDRELRKEYPLFQTISLVEPKLYAETIKEVKKSFIDGNLNNLDEKGNILAQIVLEKYLLQASNENIYNLINYNYRTYKKLLKKAPEVIIYNEFGATNHIIKKPLDIRGFIKEKEFKMWLDLINEIIISAAHSPQPPLGKEEFEKAIIDFSNIIKEISIRYGENNAIPALANEPLPDLNIETRAKIILFFYKRIIELGINDGVNIIKSLYMIQQADNLQ